MTRDIVPTRPSASRRFTRRGRDEFLEASHVHLRVHRPGDTTVRFHLKVHLGLRHSTFSTSYTEPAINNRRTKEPLRDENPPGRYQRPADSGADFAFRSAVTGMGEDEGEERDGDPEPGAFDEEDVEEVVFAGKV